MALEEPQDNDIKLHVDGYDFLIAEELEQVYKQFDVDYSNSFLRKGFTVTPDRGGGSC